jgi:hypothetical protein
LKLSITDIVRSVNNFTQAKQFQLKEFIMVLLKSKAVYNELFKTGEIQITAEGEKVIIELKSNVCGDILISIRSNENSVFAGQDVMKLILTDNKIEHEKEIALKVLRQKHEGLIAVPNLISLLINILVILLSVIFTFHSLVAVFHGNIVFENAKDLWPWILPLITFLLRKRISSWLISFSFRFF